MANGSVLAAVALGLLLLGGEAECKKKKKKKGKDSGEGVETAIIDAVPADVYRQAANATVGLVLLTAGADVCGADCEEVGAMVHEAALELRLKDASIKIFRTVLDPRHPLPADILRLLGTMPLLPSIFIFKAGEPTDFASLAASRRRGAEEMSDAGGDLAPRYGLPPSAKALVSRLLAERALEVVQPLRTARQVERFLHLDSWAASHATEEPTRVVGFFRSTSAARYHVFERAAAKVQGLVSFGVCTDSALQTRFLGGPVGAAGEVHVVKASRSERKLLFPGPWNVPSVARFAASHSGELVRDVSSQESFTEALQVGLPAFLLLMPDEYESQLKPIMDALKAVVRAPSAPWALGAPLAHPRCPPRRRPRASVASSPSSTDSRTRILGRCSCSSSTSRAMGRVATSCSADRRQTRGVGTGRRPGCPPRHPSSLSTKSFRSRLEIPPLCRRQPCWTLRAASSRAGRRPVRRRRRRRRPPRKTWRRSWTAFLPSLRSGARGRRGRKGWCRRPARTPPASARARQRPRPRGPHTAGLRPGMR